MQLGDSAGVRWLRAHRLQPGDGVEPDAPPYHDRWSPGMRVLLVLAANGDTASIPSMLALVPDPAGADNREREFAIVLALTRYPRGEGRRLVARAIEQRPWLWHEYLQIADSERDLSTDPDVRAAVDRIRARERAR